MTENSYGPGTSRFIKPRSIRTIYVLAIIGLTVVCLGIPEAAAMQDDTMRAGLTTLESFLTGNILRLLVIGGSVYGAYQAYVASKPGMLGGAIATGLGVNFLMTWAKSTWTMIL